MLTKEEQAKQGNADPVGAGIHEVLKTGEPVPAVAPRIYITRETVAKARDVRIEDVHVPEWGGWVTIKGLTGEERDEYETSLRIKKNGKNDVNTINMRAKLVVRCAVVSPADHSRIWSDDDAPRLGKKSAKVISRLFDKAQELSGISEEDTDELEKNHSSDGPTA